MEPVEGDVLVKALRVDHAAIAQRDPRLLAEKCHVAVQVEKSLANAPLLHLEAVDDFAALDVQGNDLVKIRLRGDSIHDLVGAKEEVVFLADFILAAKTETARISHLYLALGESLLQKLAAEQG